MLQDVFEFYKKVKNNQQHFELLTTKTIDEMFYELTLVGLGHLSLTNIKIPVDAIIDEIKTLEFNPLQEADRYAGRHGFVIFGTEPDQFPLNPVNNLLDDSAGNVPLPSGRWVNESVAPKTTAFFKNEFPVINYRHIVIMLLKPQGYIDQHRDTHEMSKNINIPLTLPDNSFACNTQGIIDYQIGVPCLFNTGIDHAIANPSNEDRYMISIGVNEYGPELKKQCVMDYLEQRKRSLQASR
jgi:hypothetical protein